jgi:uncharacterized membrane protein
MNTGKSSRFVAPLAVLIGGTIVSVAIGVGHGWSNGLIGEVATIVISFGYWLATGSKSDLGAVYRNKVDERQQIVYWRASALSVRVMLLAAFVIAVVTVALKANYWQADLIGSLGGLTFILGLANYGANDEQSEHDDVDPVRRDRSSGAVD